MRSEVTKMNILALHISFLTKAVLFMKVIGVASRCCCKEVYRYPHNWRAERASLVC